MRQTCLGNFLIIQLSVNLLFCNQLLGQRMREINDTGLHVLFYPFLRILPDRNMLKWCSIIHPMLLTNLAFSVL